MIKHHLESWIKLEIYRSLTRALNLLTRTERLKILMSLSIQVFLGLLDLLGVALIGILGAIAVSGFGSGVPGDRVSSVLDFISLADKPFRTQACIIGIVAGVVLTLKTLISVYLSRRTLFFLSNLSARITADFIKKLLSMPLNFIKQKNFQEYQFSMATGVPTLILGIIGGSVTFISDFSLFILLTFGLFIVNPLLALLTLAYFTLISVSLYYLMNVRARLLGERAAGLSIKSTNLLLESLSTYRELVVRNQQYNHAKLVGDSRMSLSRDLAEIQFMPSISKYAIEVSIVIGALLISASQFLTQTGSHAVATLSIFLAAGSRIAPAAMRLQQSAVQLKTNVGTTFTTLELIECMNLTPIKESTSIVSIGNYEGFVPSIEATGVCVSYDGNFKAISDANIRISQGSLVAIVGPSGGGKTTLVDSLLGIIELSSGHVEISGVSPREAFERWPGAIAYVPQDVFVMDASVEDNIEMGLPIASKNSVNLERAVIEAQLSNVVPGMSNQEFSTVGERGSKLSGGQRQRIGLARALYTQPRLLVLDEATSALDAETEHLISDSLNKLRGTSTVIMIAHRLSTVRSADLVIYVDQGKIQIQGTFDQVREGVPEFNKAAGLMGL